SAAVAGRDAPACVHYRVGAGIPGGEMECHFFQPSFCGDEPWVPFPFVFGLPAPGGRLDILIFAPPVSALPTSNSSIAARMRKIPRPEVLRRFASASGSGTSFKRNPEPSSAT